MKHRWGFLLVLAVFPVLHQVSAQTSVHFDRARYDILPGEAFQVEVVIEPSPESGLSSYGIVLSLDGSHAEVRDPASISVPAELDFNGVTGQAAVRETTDETAGVKGTVSFFASPPAPYHGVTLAIFTVNDLAPGPYPLGLGAFNTLGPTEEIFVSGDGEVLDSSLEFGTALVNYRPLIEITNPKPGDTFIAPGELLISADAHDLDGQIARVQLYEGSNLLEEVVSEPYRISHAFPTPGIYHLTAIAWDDLGATNHSGEVIFQIQEPEGDLGPIAIFAGEANQPKGSKVLSFAGSRHSTRGGIHSNSDIDVAGNHHSMTDGDVEYVTTVNPSPDFKGKVSFDNGRLMQSTTKPYPVSYSLADFALGGPHAEAASAQGRYFHIRNNTDLKEHITNRRLSDGLYYVEGAIHLSGNGLSGQATLVATEGVQLSANGLTLRPYVEDLLAFSGLVSTRFDQPGVRISASGVRAEGIVFVPDAAIHVSGSDHAFSPGSLIGRSVAISGSGFQINGYEPASAGRATGAPSQAPNLLFSAMDMSLSLPTSPGTMYVIEYTDSLDRPQWHLCAVIEGNGTVMTVQPPSGATRRFFRVRASNTRAQ